MTDYLQCPKMATSKADNSELWFLCSAHHIMVIYIRKKLHLQNVSRNYLKQFSSYRADTYIPEITIFNVQSTIIPKAGVQQLLFLCSALCLIMLYICMKFYQNICNSFQLTELTSVHGRYGYFQ